MSAIKRSVVNAWYQGAYWLVLLRPLSFLFRKLVEKRRRQYVSGRKMATRLPVPVVVVGNISVGGTGKTPLVIFLVESLKERGYKPGVISRGYGGESSGYPLLVNASSDVAVVGDEAHLIVQRTDVPMAIDPNRVNAAQHLLKHFDCDVIISDDGLQHYPLARDIEIVVIDAQRGFGNGRCLPSGPLREPLQRLGIVDFIVVNGNEPLQLERPYCRMQVANKGLYEVSTFHHCHGLKLSGTVHGVAGIGNPQRFFTRLRDLGLEVIEHEFDDHHTFKPDDFDFDDGVSPIVMTEKDAVKCRAFSKDHWLFLKISVEPSDNFFTDFFMRLQQLKQNYDKSKL